MDLFDVLRSFSRAISTLLSRIFGRATAAPIHRKRLLLLQSGKMRLAYRTEQKPVPPMTVLRTDETRDRNSAETQSLTSHD